MRIHELFLTAAAAAFLSGTVLFSAGSASAQTCPGVSQQQCEEFCGAAGVASCTKTGSTPDCVCNETKKEGVSGNAFGTETQDTAEGQGNLGNKTETACEGNVGQCKKQ